MRHVILILILTSALQTQAKLKEGVYRGVMLLDETLKVEAPFNFELKYKSRKPQIIIRNADERIVVDEITVKGDSVIIKMPVFDTEFRTVLKGNDLVGIWINNYRTSKNRLPFHATFGEARRFLFLPGKGNTVFDGRWEATFSPGKSDSSKAVGVFRHMEQTDFISGTFLTETGDYRYLEGMQHEGRLYLSCFDGGRVFLFTGYTKDGLEITNGKFYSGTHWREDWMAKRNDKYSLRDAESLTWVKDKDAEFSFSYPDTDGQQVSLKDKRFAGKPVVLQVMGSWCPNCMDECRYFSEIQKKYGEAGLEIVALAFEKTSDQKKATEQVRRMKQRLGLNYPILITGVSGRENAAKVLSPLNDIMAFPTTIFLDRKHKVVKIHTGFSGPATGKEFENYKENTDALINKLIAN